MMACLNGRDLMKNLFRIHSIKNKIFFNFILLFLITGSGLSTLYSMTVNILSDMATESVEAMLDQINTETYRVMSHALRTGYMIANDASIQFPLRNPLPDTEKLMYKQRLEYNNKLFYTNQYQESISGVYIIGTNGAIFRSSMTSLIQNDYRNEEWYTHTLKARKPIWYTNQTGSLVAKTLKEPFISIAIPINDRSSTRQLGLIVVELKGDIFKNIYNTGLLLEGDIFIVDSTQQVFIYSKEMSSANNEQTDINKVIQQHNFSSTENTQKINIEGEDYLVSNMPVNLNNWNIVAVIPYREIYSRTKSIENSIIIVLLLFTIIMFLFMIRVSNMISKPVKNLSNTMKTVESGKFDIQVEVKTNDEFGYLAKSFNHMLKKINLLTKKELDNQRKLRKAELKALQSQINPHFLYNTLDSIGWMARLNKIDKVEEMLDSLSTYFRISISRGSDFISLREELTHVQKYLSIQKIRYEKKLNYTIDVPEEILKFKTIKMILQPLVENSIYHGLKEKEGPGEIKITATMTDHIAICVEDTGIGMTPEELDELHEMIASDKDYNPNAYGVINVHKRIQVFFGENYGLRYESEYGMGTKVFVTLGKVNEV